MKYGDLPGGRSESDWWTTPKAILSSGDGGDGSVGSFGHDMNRTGPWSTQDYINNSRWKVFWLKYQVREAHQMKIVVDRISVFLHYIA